MQTCITQVYWDSELFSTYLLFPQQIGLSLLNIFYITNNIVHKYKYIVFFVLTPIIYHAEWRAFSVGKSYFNIFSL